MLQHTFCDEDSRRQTFQLKLASEASFRSMRATTAIPLIPAVTILRSNNLDMIHCCITTSARVDSLPPESHQMLSQLCECGQRTLWLQMKLHSPEPMIPDNFHARTRNHQMCGKTRLHTCTQCIWVSPNTDFSR